MARDFWRPLVKIYGSWNFQKNKSNRLLSRYEFWTFGEVVGSTSTRLKMIFQENNYIWEYTLISYHDLVHDGTWFILRDFHSVFLRSCFTCKLSSCSCLFVYFWSQKTHFRSKIHTKIYQNRLKSIKIDQNRSKLIKIGLKTAKNHQKMIKNDQKWSKIIKLCDNVMKKMNFWSQISLKSIKIDQNRF